MYPNWYSDIPVGRQRTLYFKGYHGLLIWCIIELLFPAFLKKSSFVLSFFCSFFVDSKSYAAKDDWTETLLKRRTLKETWFSVKIEIKILFSVSVRPSVRPSDQNLLFWRIILMDEVIGGEVHLLPTKPVYQILVNFLFGGGGLKSWTRYISMSRANDP